MAYPSKWTPEEDEVLLKMRADGFSFPQIGQAMGRNPVQAASHWRNLQKTRACGLKKQVAPPWTPEEDALVDEWRAQKITWAEIGRRLKRSHTSCSVRWQWRKKKAQAEGGEPVVATRISVSHDLLATALPKTYWRKCHDCGKLTHNYRCDKCREKFYKRHHVDVENAERSLDE